ncbi:MAG: YicC family protein [Marinilabiliaceae bacterium]|nr:YicC family protein [Marinilabiliaceae bacterium]
MIYSMTGYGKSVCELSNKKISIEIRSLNSKQLDLNIRIPIIYREKELEIRNEISSLLNRGKIDVSFFVESVVSDKITQINKPVIELYYNQLKEISDSLGLSNDSTDYLKIIMPLPETVKTELAELDESEWGMIKKVFYEAVTNINLFREQEGLVLANELNKRICNIRNYLTEVEQFETVRIDRIKSRLKDSLEEMAAKSQIDENRFEQELIFYIEKLDITEEKVRLMNHLDYFIETMNQQESAGKKLGFITQEIGREVNTLGSKANDASMQRIVIQMKDELEKIKEQLLNIL